MAVFESRHRLRKLIRFEISLEFTGKEGEDVKRGNNQNLNLRVKNNDVLYKPQDDLKIGNVIKITSGLLAGCESEIIWFEGNDIIIEYERFGKAEGVRAGKREAKASEQYFALRVINR